jgi:hypothetical protein
MSVCDYNGYMLNNTYGCNETNPLPRGGHDEKIVGSLSWDSPELASIERLRLLSDPGFPAWDVSYCYGRNKQGERVSVGLPFSQLPKRTMRRAIVAHARKAKVYAKGLGIFDAISTLC